MGGKLLKWFEDYLRGWKQKVVIEGFSSDTEDLQAGVHQGSILGPMIFLIYINDLVEEVNSEIRLYVDDTSLYLDYNDTVEQLQQDINHIEKWAKKPNPDKTESLIFSRKGTVNTPQMYKY